MPKTNNNSKVNITISVDEEVSKELDKMAEATGLSRSACYNMIARAALFGEAEVLSTLLVTLKDQIKPKAKTARKPKVATA